MNYQKIVEDAGVVTYERGDNFAIICPFHSETKPSCSISEENGMFHCFGCGERGSFAKLMEEIDSKYVWRGFEEEEVEIVKQKKIRLSEKVLGEFKPAHLVSASEYYIRTQRKIWDYKSFDLRYCTISSRKGRWCGRIIFPIYDLKGKFLSISGRTIFNVQPKSLKYPKVRVNTFYGVKQLPEGWEDFVVIVEGEFDAIYLQQFGVPAIALLGTGVKRFTNEQMDYLLTKKKVVVSLDGDEAGRKATLQLTKQLAGLVHVRVMELPFGKDPNDLKREEVEGIYKDFVGWKKFKE